MKDLYLYLTEEEQINEGLFSAGIGLAYIRRMEPDYLLNGLLNMYEYIVSKSDIKLFYEDFPIKERPFWTTIYKLYENQLWSIFDADKPNVDTTQDNDKLQDYQDDLNDLQSKEVPGDAGSKRQHEKEIRDLERKINSLNNSISKQNEDMIGDCFPEDNSLINVTPEFRRELRNIIKGSSVGQSDLNANNVEKIMLINDPKFDKRYIFTINKTPGLFKKLFKLADKKILEKMFEKISEL